MIWDRARSLAVVAGLSTGLLAGSIQADAIELPQHGGGSLVLDRPAQRIATLAPHLAELAYLAGAGDRLVATVEYSDYPEDALAVPRIGDAFRFDLERLMALAPDLVVAWDSGNPGAALTAMDQLGLAVWRTEIRTVGDMTRLIRDFGRAAGTDSTPRAEAVERRWSGLERQHANRATVRYFYQVAERPLYTVSGDHLISQSLAACGAENVFDELRSLAPQIDREAVLQADPDVLVAGRVDADDDPLAAWRAWPRMAAVRDDALFYLPADLINRATPRLLDAVEMACDLFDDYRNRPPEATRP